jgi:hypothetical protein
MEIIISNCSQEQFSEAPSSAPPLVPLCTEFLLFQGKLLSVSLVEGVL